jgi:hypothetical protein
MELTGQKVNTFGYQVGIFVGTGTKFLITKFLITKFLITKFLITKFLSNKVPNALNS